MFSPDDSLSDAAIDLLVSARGKRFGTILADPPWQFQDRTGKVAPRTQPLHRAWKFASEGHEIVDVTNADRAQSALDALCGFVEETQVDTARDAIADLVVNLLHLARGRGLDPDLLVRQALGMMAEEVAEDEEGSMASVQRRFRELVPEDDG